MQGLRCPPSFQGSTLSWAIASYDPVGDPDPVHFRNVDLGLSAPLSGLFLSHHPRLFDPPGLFQLSGWLQELGLLEIAEEVGVRA